MEYIPRCIRYIFSAYIYLIGMALVFNWDEKEDLTEEEQQLLERLRTVRERVEYILGRYPNARNSDFYLIILYIRKFIPELAKYIKYIPYEIICKHDGLFESVRRARQKIQEEGRFLPTDPNVLKRRRKLAEKYRKIIPRL